jgi:hypothetical protein
MKVKHVFPLGGIQARLLEGTVSTGGVAVTLFIPNEQPRVRLPASALLFEVACV